MKDLNPHLYKHDGKLFVKLCGCNHIPYTHTPYLDDTNKFPSRVKTNDAQKFLDLERCEECLYWKWIILPREANNGRA